jgi:cytochrome c oxidase subunit II
MVRKVPNYYMERIEERANNMKILLTSCFLLFVLLLISGCASSGQFTAMPPGLDREKIPVQKVKMTAERFRFTPDAIHVKAGTLVRIDVKSVNGTLGFELGAFGIDESLDERETKTIEFFAQEKGEYTFRCSHFCGIGHFGMKGTIIVE